MKRILLALALVCAPIAALCQTVTLTGSKIEDSSGSPCASCTISFAPKSNAGAALSYRIGGGGQALTKSVTAQVTNGAFSLPIADVNLTNPQNVCFAATVTDNLTGGSYLGPGYTCVQPSSALAQSGWCATSGGSTTCNFDNYIPTAPPQTLVTTGPQGPSGPAGATGPVGPAGGAILPDVIPNRGLNPISGMAFGDSNGTNAYTNTPFPTLLGNYLGFVMTNYHVSGDQACDTAYQVFYHYAPSPVGPQPLITIWTSSNDAFWPHAGAYEATFHKCLNAIQSYATIPSSYKVVGSAATATGTCANDTTLLSVTGKRCTASGSTLTVTLPTTTKAGPVYIWMWSIDADAGTYTYAIDSGTPISTTTALTPAIGTINGRTAAPIEIRIPNVPSGSHTLTLVQTSSGTMAFIAAGRVPEGLPNALPTLIEAGTINTLDNSAFASDVAAYRADVKADLQSHASDGLQIYYAPCENYVPMTTVAGDTANTYHMNTVGHYEAASCILSVMKLIPGNVNAAASLISTTVPSVDSFIYTTSTVPALYKIAPGYNIFSGGTASPGYSTGVGLAQTSTNVFNTLFFTPAGQGYWFCTYAPGVAFTATNAQGLGLSCTQFGYKSSITKVSDMANTLANTNPGNTANSINPGPQLFGGSPGYASGSMLTKDAVSRIWITHYTNDSTFGYKFCTYPAGTDVSADSQFNKCWQLPVPTTTALMLPLTASISTSSSTSDNYTLTGMTSTGHCSLAPTNSSAAADYGAGTAFVSAKTTSQVTIAHAATSGETFDLLCTAY